MKNRRALLRATLAGTAGLALSGSPVAVFAQGANPEPVLKSDDGAPVQTWRLPSEIPLDQPGLIVVGGASPDVMLYEFFDYNCPWCKKSAPDLAKLVSADKDFSLRLIQMPVLSLGSVQAAKIVIATQAVAGNAKAFELHSALLAMRGQVAGIEALAALTPLGLDRKAIEANADSDETRMKLKAQTRTGSSLGMQATPSFAINGMAFGGWPGAGAVGKIVKAVRACDKIAC